MVRALSLKKERKKPQNDFVFSHRKLDQFWLNLKKIIKPCNGPLWFLFVAQTKGSLRSPGNDLCGLNDDGVSATGQRKGYQHRTWRWKRMSRLFTLFLQSFLTPFTAETQCYCNMCYSNIGFNSFKTN